MRFWATAGLLFGSLAHSGQATSEPAVPTGVVVTEVTEGSALEKAGLEPGDLLLAWQRLPNPANPQQAKGELRSPFDWEWVRVEQAPRGAVRLRGEHEGKPKVWTVEPGSWEAKVRPTMPAARLTQYLLAQELVTAGDLESASALWEELADQEELGSSRCWLYLHLGEAWSEKQAWERAMRAYRSALEAARDPEAQVVVWDAFRKTYLRQNDFDQAEASLLRALEIHGETWGEGLGFALDLHRLGRVARYRDQLDETAEHNQRALEIQQKLAPDSLDVAGSLNTMGVLANDRGQLDVAAEHFQRALEIYRKLAPGGLGVAGSLSNLGVVALKRARLEVAQDHFQRALEIQQKLAPDSLDVARSLNNLGIVAKDRGQLDLAEEHHLRALAIKQELVPDGLELAASLTNLGIVARRRGQLDEAAQYQERALAIKLELAPDSLAVARSLHNLGSIANDRGQLDLAEEYFDRSLDVLRAQIRRLGGSPFVKGDFRAQHSELYHGYIEFLLQRSRPEKAFAVLEHSRAQSFLAMLEERELVFSDIPEELDRQRRSLALRQDRILRHLASLSATRDQEKVETLQAELADLYRERGRLRAEIRRRSPHLADLRDPRPFDLAGFRNVLDPATVMLSYSVAEERIDLFVVTSERPVTVHTLAMGANELREKVRSFRETIDKPYSNVFLADLSRKAAERMGRLLYKTLVEPADDVVETSERVVLVPDGPLHLLPFAALIREIGDDSTSTGRDWQYFAEWKPLHSVLSATVYAELRESRRTAPPTSDSGPLLVALGDPRYPPDLEHVGADGEDPAGVLVRSARDSCGLAVGRLPASRREVLGISSLYRNVQTYLGEGAREEIVKSLDGDARILHIAAHGCLDDRLPLNSGLFLTLPEDFPDDRDNGLLQAWEIFESVRLGADLVVLSACESGLGEEQGGEGLIGLTRAFQYAGARTVAASLWQVDDQVTAELMVRFYRHLRRGETKDVALRAAQVELIREPIEIRDEDGQARQVGASAPYYWAAFQLLGDWR